MDVLAIIFGGLGGAVLTCLVMLHIHHKSHPAPTGKAYDVLKKLGKVLHHAPGTYYFSDSGDTNFRIASHLYSNADGRVIATAFNEDPAQYGSSDLARNLGYGGSLFTRLTCRDVCGRESEKAARAALEELKEGARLVVIPSGELFSRVDGMFCQFSDDTYVCFVAFRSPAGSSRNAGAIFIGRLASAFFQYYADLIGKYS